MLLHTHTHKIIECNDWDDVKKNLSVYVTNENFLQAQSMINEGLDHWHFVYGFCVDTLTITKQEEA